VATSEGRSSLTRARSSIGWFAVPGRGVAYEPGVAQSSSGSLADARGLRRVLLVQVLHEQADLWVARLL
jgi:hypothetical protein